MLAHDFIELFSDKYNLFPLNSKELDITNLENIETKIKEINPDIVLNFAAYTAVDDAEDI
jgi:dTDP-4-dehydrorhamnose reductase